MASSFSSAPDHQIPCPPITIGRSASQMMPSRRASPDGIGPGARCRARAACPGPFVAARVRVEGRKHDVDRQADMHRPRIAGGRRLPCPVDEFTDAFAIGDLNGILHQRRGDRHIVDFLEAARALPLERRGAGDEDHRRALAAGFEHCGHGICEPLGPDQADRGLAGDPRVPVGQVSRDLFVGAVDHRYPAFHEPLECRIAESAGQGEGVVHSLFLQRAGQQGAAADSVVLPHVANGLPSVLGRDPERPLRV